MIILDEKAFTAADTRPSPWAPVVSLVGVALVLSLMRTMASGVLQMLTKKR